MAPKAIGPNFGNEIAHAAIGNGDFAWKPNGAINFGPTMTPAQIAAVDAVYAAHDPAKPAPITRLSYADFRARWQDAEKQALFKARAATWQIDDFITLAAASGEIDLTAPDTAAAEAAIVAAGVLTQARANAIFATS